MNELTPIEFNNEMVLTTRQLAMVYETDANNIRNNFKNHRRHFVEEKHYYLLEGEVLKLFKRNINNIDVVKPSINQLYLWTERGANRHCKILDTDKAWEQFGNLEETYFRVKKQNALNSIPPIEYLAGFASLLNSIRRIMKDQNSPACKIAAQTQMLCRCYSVPLLDDFVEIPEYEQISFEQKLLN